MALTPFTIYKKPSSFILGGGGGVGGCERGRGLVFADIKRQKTLPGQSPCLHSISSIICPLQLPTMSGFIQTRMRIFTPTPHVIEQEPQGCHGDQ